MIRQIITITLGAIFATSLLTPTAMAHTKVQSATLKDGGVYQTVPDVFELVFVQKVGLATLTLKDGDGQTVNIDFKPPKSMEAKFSIPMPKLKSGEYRMSWRAIATDGHILKDGLSFTVK